MWSTDPARGTCLPVAQACSPPVSSTFGGARNHRPVPFEGPSSGMTTPRSPACPAGYAADWTCDCHGVWPVSPRYLAGLSAARDLDPCRHGRESRRGSEFGRRHRVSLQPSPTRELTLKETTSNRPAVAGPRIIAGRAVRWLLLRSRPRAAYLGHGRARRTELWRCVACHGHGIGWSGFFHGHGTTGFASLWTTCGAPVGVVVAGCLCSQAAVVHRASVPQDRLVD